MYMGDAMDWIFIILFSGASFFALLISLIYLHRRNRQHSIFAMIAAEIEVNVEIAKSRGFPIYVETLPMHIAHGEDVPVPDLLDNTAVVDVVYRSATIDIATLKPSISQEICRFYTRIYGIQSTLKKLADGIANVEPEDRADILTVTLRQWTETEALAERIVWELRKLDAMTFFEKLQTDLIQHFRRCQRSEVRPS